jgi:hypothetical protein
LSTGNDSAPGTAAPIEDAEVKTMEVSSHVLMK